MMCGGKSADRDADPEVQSLLDTVSVFFFNIICIIEFKNLFC